MSTGTDVRELSVTGARVFTPPTFADARGAFTSPFQESVFTAQLGHGLFPVAQVSYSRSRRAVVRGVHYTAAPPGTAKYVYCPHGRALDVVVDLRVGSPTFGRWESVVLDPDHARAVYLPVGVGHLFAALRDDTIMSYTLSAEYEARNELALQWSDPALALELPEDIHPVLSERDSAAPTLAEAQAQYLLPEYERCVELDGVLRSRAETAR